MATKLDIIDAGRKNVTLGLMASNPYKAGSWQNQAWEQGFQQAMDEKPDTVQVAVEDALVVEPVVPALTKEAKHHTVTIVPVLAKSEYVQTMGPRPMPRAAIEHINALHRAAATCSDSKRFSRLKRKVDTLVAKWEKRTHAGR